MSSFADDVTRQVLGVTEVLGQFGVRSAPAAALAADPPIFGPADAQRWATERAWLVEVDDWFVDDVQPRVASALEQVPLLDRVLLVLEAGETLADVGLFELKRFAFWAAEIVEVAEAVLPQNEWAHELRELMTSIHPEAHHTPRFALSAELDVAVASARAEVKRLRRLEQSERAAAEAAIAADHAGSFDLEGWFLADTVIDDPRLLHVRDRTYRVTVAALDRHATALSAAKSACAEAEETLRRTLSDQLRSTVGLLTAVRHAVAHLDFAISRVELRRCWNGCWPAWDEPMRLRDGLHPRLLSESKQQRISIEIASAAAVVTGPNMGGKSMLLKNLGLAQWCAQHGFPVAAQSFHTMPVARLCYVGADAPDVWNHKGLSAFGREVRRVVDQRSADGQVFWLLDEFARGTHPAEGAELARDFVADRLSAGDRVLAATHFPTLAAADFAEQFQIAGLQRELALGAAAHTDGGDDLEAVLRAAMDYQPLPRDPKDNDVPRDARLVAALLGLTFNE